MGLEFISSECLGLFQRTQLILQQAQGSQLITICDYSYKDLPFLVSTGTRHTCDAQTYMQATTATTTESTDMHLKHEYYKLMSHLRLSPLSISSGSSEAASSSALSYQMSDARQLLMPLKVAGTTAFPSPISGSTIVQKISTADVNPQIWVYSTVRGPHVFHPRGSSAPDSTPYSWSDF